MKSKNAPQTMRQKIIAWLPLLVVLIALAIQSGLVSFRDTLLSAGGPTLLYLPGLDNTKGLSLFSLVSLMSIALFLLYVCFYVRKRQKHVIENIVFLSSSLIFIIGLCIPTIGIQIKHLDTVYTDQHTYHLFSQMKLFPYGLYTVLECDPLGLMCHAYGTPDKTSPIAPGTCTTGYAHLEQDSVTQELMLFVGEHTYTLDPVGAIYVYQKCMNLITRT